MRGLGDSGLSFDRRHLLQCNLWTDLISEEAYRKTRQYLEHVDNRFTALFAYNDVAALGAIRAIEEAGLHIPQDMAVVGFDNTSLAAATRPGLTSVAQPTEQIGRRATELVLKEINGSGTEKPVEIILQPRLVARQFTIGVNPGLN